MNAQAGKLDTEMATPVASDDYRGGHRTKRGRWLRIALWLGAITLIFMQLFVWPLPAKVTRYVSLQLAGPLLNEADQNDSGPVKIAKRLTALKLEQSLIAGLYNRQKIPAGAGDAEIMAAHLLQLRHMLVSQLQAPHAQVESTVTLSGLGYCGGMNGVAAILLSHHFDRAELVSFTSTFKGGGHSFGRVWSAEYADWVYFDIWGGEVDIFLSKPGQKALYLVRSKEVDVQNPMDPEMAGTRAFHDRAHSALVQSTLQPTLGGYLWARLGNWVDHGSTWPESAQILVRQEAALPDLGYRLNFQPKFTRAPQAYMEARIDHLSGNMLRAKTGYARVIAADKGHPSAFAAAATVFSGNDGEDDARTGLVFLQR